MASNKELIEKIKAINPDAETDGLKNTQLVAMLKILAPPEDAPAPPEAPKAKGYVIAKGKAITSERGILSAEDGIVVAKDFNGGDETFQRLIKSGAIVKG